MKKLKLSLSIAMMCLCVAVLCMGILAASSATYNINGNMSYNMIDGVALVNTRVYKVAGTETDLSTQCTTLSTKSFEEIERETSTYYILSQKLDSQPLINTSSDGTSASNTTSVDIVYGATDSAVEYYTYYIVVEIKNGSTDTGYALNAYLNTLNTSTISNIASNANGESNSIEIKSGEFSNIIIGLSYTGTTTTSETFSYTLNISYDKLPFPDNLTNDTTNSYWYAELGTLSDNITPIRWRVVSLDGTTKYTYSSTKPEVGTGTIFLQETYLGSMPAFDTSGSGNYFDSSIRTTINTLSTWNLTELDISSIIAPRNITSIDYYTAFGNTCTKNTSKTPLSGSTSGDYFWLMDGAETKTYFTSDADRKWTPNNYTSAPAWWLRSPYSYDASYACCVSYNGYWGNNNAGRSDYCAVRAAFQLA